jgi:hypothetical protein
MAENLPYDYDVFLSYSSKDEFIVRPLAERLRHDGVKVWFDKWAIKPAQHFPRKIEEGLEKSKFLITCMSAHALDSDWAQLERHWNTLADPTNKEGRLLPVRLDDTPAPKSLAQFQHIDFTEGNRESGYISILEHIGFPVIRLTSIRSVVQRHGDRFRYEVVITGVNPTDQDLGASGLTIHFPELVTPELCRSAGFTFAATRRDDFRFAESGGEIWGFQDNGDFGPKRATCVFLESFLNFWRAKESVTLSVQFEAPVPHMEMHVRAWARPQNAHSHHDTAGDPGWKSSGRKDQQNIPTYVHTAGFTHP